MPPFPHTDRAVRQRLASPEQSVRAGAAWELWIEDWLRRRGAELVRHPVVQGLTRRPDLHARVDRSSLYVEATATGGGALHGHRQATAHDRLHDVLMSRLKQKSRAFQGIDEPLLLAVLCIAPEATEAVAASAVAELFDPVNERGRNVSGVLIGWQLDTRRAPNRLRLHHHPRASAPLPPWLQV